MFLVSPDMNMSSQSRGVIVVFAEDEASDMPSDKESDVPSGEDASDVPSPEDDDEKATSNSTKDNDRDVSAGFAPTMNSVLAIGAFTFVLTL
jgi:hypothetical protein